jgi:cell division protein FtsN
MSKSTKKSKSASTTVSEPVQETKASAVAPSEPVEAESKEDNVNSAYIQTSTGRVNPTQPYHVIAGAFREKANAERFRDRLRENGNSNSEIIGEFDGLFIVSASSHQSMEEAQNSRKSNSTITQSWIFQWP